MKHAGKARRAAFKMILLSLIAVIVIWVLGIFSGALITLITAVAVAITPFVIGMWILFALFTLYFFRDPTPSVPAGANLLVSPGHGKVDVIDKTTEAQFMGGECQRISMFLSVFNVHVQNAPVAGRIGFFKYTTGQFINAMKTESAIHNENLLIGFEALEPAGQRVGVRLIAGVIARRIVPYVQLGETVQRGDRISLIQFGSRLDVYLPLNAAIKVNIGDHVVGGETILAELSVA